MLTTSSGLDAGRSVPTQGPSPRNVGLLAGLVALASGGLLAPATYGPGDSPSLTLALAYAGVPHPTGYPLWTLAGHAFCRALRVLGLEWAHAANLWSSVGAGVAIALVVRLAWRLGEREGLAARHALAAAILTAVVLAANPVWLGGATLAEVNAWHWAWVAWAIDVAHRTLERARVAGGPSTGAAAARAGLAWGLLCAAGLAHHRTTLAFAIPLTLALAPRRPLPAKVSAAWALSCLAGVAAAALPYAWIAWRAYHPAPGQWPLLEPTWASVLAHVQGRIYTVMLGGFAPSAPDAARLALGVWPLLPAALAGVVALALRAGDPSARALGVALAGAAVLQLGFVFFYGVADPSNYFVPVLLAGLATWPAALARLREARRPAGLSVLGVVAAAALIFWVPAVMRESSSAVAFDRRIREIWSRVPPGPGIVLWQSDEFARLRAYQLIEGQRPDLVVDNPDVLTWEPARRAFEARTGVDPLRDLQLREQADVAAIPFNVARQARVPTWDFEDLARR